MGLFSFLTADNHTKPPLGFEATQQLEAIARASDALLLRSTSIYLRQEAHTVEALIFDPDHGIYLLDYCDWRYEELKGATVEHPNPDDKRARDVNLDTLHEFIRGKFNEILHTDPCDIKNFLLLEHLSAEEFDQLDMSFHKFLPKDRLIFAQESAEESLAKLHAAIPKRDHTLNIPNVLGALFFHLQISSDNLHTERALLSLEQRHFIESELPPLSTLCGPYGSGKSSLILLKAILILLQKKARSILIVAATQVACDLLKKQMLEIVEYAIIDIELTSIRILTPEQLIAQHYQKLYKKESFSFAKITPKMLSHHYDAADIIFCDDSHLLDNSFVSYLYHLQRKHTLCLVRRDISGNPTDYPLTSSFRTPQAMIDLCINSDDTPIEGVKRARGNPYMLMILELQKLLQQYTPTQMLIIVPHPQFALKLLDEINSYYGTIAELYQAHEGLLALKPDRVMIATILDIAHLQRPVVLLIHDETCDHEHFCHAITRASKQLYLIQSESTYAEIPQDTARMESDSPS